MKVVINACYGGFSLSAKATKRIAELQGKECYFFAQRLPYTGEDKDKYIPLTLEEAEDTFLWWAYSVPNPQDYRLNERDPDGLYKGANERADEIRVSDRDILRHDPMLIQVVEELGAEASGRHAKLKIVEIPDGTDYVIEEYDGFEHIAEAHKTWS